MRFRDHRPFLFFAANRDAIVMTEIGGHTRAEILERSFEAAPSALLVVNREGRIVLANQQCERLFGYSREELIGKYVETLVPAPLRGLHAALRNSYIDDPAGPWMKTGRELLALRKDGTELPADIRLSPVPT